MAQPLKQPPYSVHAEGVVLGTLLRHPELFEQLHAILGDGSVFFRGQYERFFKVMVTTHASTEGLDHVALMTEAARSGLHEMSQRADLDALISVASHPDHAIELARMINDKALLRELIDLLSDILHDASRTADPFGVVLRRARGRLDEFDSPLAGQPATAAAHGRNRRP